MSAERKTLDLLWDVRELVDPQLGGAHKAMLYALIALRSQRKRPDGSVYFVIRPSVEQIASGAGVSRATAIRELPELVRLGYVVRDRRSRREVATYTLTVPERSHGATTPETLQDATSQHEPSVVAGCDLSVVASANPSGRRMSHSEESLRIEKDPSEEIHTSPSAPVPAGAGTSAVVQPLKLSLDGEKTKSEKPSKGRPQTSADATCVFDAYLTCWRNEIGKGEEPQLSPKRAALIRARLRRFSIERITRAFEGLFASPYHRGQNESGTRYLDPEQVLRADERVELFEGKANGTGTTTPVRKPYANGAIKQAQAPTDLRPWAAKTAGQA